MRYRQAGWHPFPDGAHHVGALTAPVRYTGAVFSFHKLTISRKMVFLMYGSDTVSDWFPEI